MNVRNQLRIFYTGHHSNFGIYERQSCAICPSKLYTCIKPGIWMCV